MALATCRVCGFEEPAEARVGSGAAGACDACDAHARLRDWVSLGCVGAFPLDPSLDVVRVPEASQEFLSVASRAWMYASMVDGKGGDVLARVVAGSDHLSGILSARAVTHGVLATNSINRAGIGKIAGELRVVVARPARNVLRAWARAGTLEGLTADNVESTGGYHG